MSRPLRSATSAIVGFGSKVTGVGAALAAMTAGVTAVAVASNSIKKSMSFEAQISSYKALTGSTAEQTKQMESLALEMGAKTKYSALEAAQAMEELVKAGMSPATVKAGGLEAALNLATAGGLDLVEAAETMSTSMNAFKKDGLTAAQTSDILAGAANAGATSVHDIGYALASVGGVADMVGMNFEDLNAAIGLLSNDALKSGSDAGTSLKSMLMYINPTTKDSIKLFKKLGLGVGKTSKFFKNGKLRDLAEVAQVLHDALKHMNEQNRTATMIDMFSTDGVKAASTLFKIGAEGVKDFREEMSKTTAFQVAEEKLNNAAGAVEMFKGELDTLQIAIGKPILPIIGDFAKIGTKALEKSGPQITSELEKTMKKVQAFYTDRYVNNPDFLALNFVDKVGVVADDLKEVFDKWWGSGGKEAFEETTTRIVNVIIASLNAASSQVLAVGTDLGFSLSKGILIGLRESWAETVIPSWLDDRLRGIGINLSGTETPAKTPASTGAASRALSSGQAPPTIWPNTSGFYEAANKHKQSGGLSRVPYSGYPAILHKDETVLHRGEARDYRNGNSGGGVNVSGNTFIVREEADIQRVAAELYRLINGADQAMGGAY
ncbi:phage tail tape measure protein [Paenibacillus luteus]|uniref:phage tail tape measure protein n=1 Tax=Paenibacillus luteus TaxID=2545753 RepID=UPI0011430447|nr:phage tail tape measure protein [Paenibacillus luteus]